SRASFPAHTAQLTQNSSFLAQISQTPPLFSPKHQQTLQLHSNTPLQHHPLPPLPYWVSDTQ
ncbi:hypothetical protein MRY87_12395, partial [bacterium]|nr:hypothetical protein [bacterium]